MGKSKRTKELEERLTTPVPRTSAIPDADWLSSGITVLNLACSGRPDGCIPKGRMGLIVGDTDSGKSWLMFSFLAEATRNPAFDNYRLIFDNAERGALFKVSQFFGQKAADRVIPPRGTVEAPEYSSTVQEFFFNVDKALDHKQPCIYVEDSVDAIGALENETHFEKEKAAFEEDKPVPGSYGMAKQKYISQHLNRVSGRLADTGSILLLVAQSRVKIGGYAGQKTFGGGDAIKFYPRIQIWSSVKETVKKTIMGKDRKIGAKIEFEVKKNHLCGWRGDVPLVGLYPSHGFDETGTCVDYLLEEKVWVKVKKESDDEEEEKESKKIEATHFGITATREKIIAHIEENGLEAQLCELVASKWAEIQAACAVNRKARY